MSTERPSTSNDEVKSSETPRTAKGSRGDSIMFFVFLLFLAVMGGYLLLPQCVEYRSDVNNMQCRNNLKQVMMALLNYHDTYKSFPPAYLPDEEGRPMLTPTTCSSLGPKPPGAKGWLRRLLISKMERPTQSY